MFGRFSQTSVEIPLDATPHADNATAPDLASAHLPSVPSDISETACGAALEFSEALLRASAGSKSSGATALMLLERDVRDSADLEVVKNLSAKAQAFLKETGVKFELAPDGSVIVFSSEGNAWMNQLAKELEDKHNGVRLCFDLRLHVSSSDVRWRFDASRNLIAISGDFLSQQRGASREEFRNLKHEIRHSDYFAQIVNRINHPYHGHLRSRSLFALDTLYGAGFSFDEIMQQRTDAEAVRSEKQFIEVASLAFRAINAVDSALRTVHNKKFGGYIGSECFRHDYFGAHVPTYEFEVNPREPFSNVISIPLIAAEDSGWKTNKWLLTRQLLALRKQAEADLSWAFAQAMAVMPEKYGKEEIKQGNAARSRKQRLVEKLYGDDPIVRLACRVGHRIGLIKI